MAEPGLSWHLSEPLLFIYMMYRPPNVDLTPTWKGIQWAGRPKVSVARWKESNGRLLRQRLNSLPSTRRPHTCTLQGSSASFHDASLPLLCYSPASWVFFWLQFLIFKIQNFLHFLRVFFPLTGMISIPFLLLPSYILIFPLRGLPDLKPEIFFT